MTLRLAFFRWWALSLVAIAACAGSTSPRPAESAARLSRPQATPGLFLYEARGKGGSVHLLGTIHMGFGFDEVLTPDARARFTSATRVMTEADVSAADPERLIQAALLPPERSLSSIVGKAVWERLLARIGGQIPPPMLDRLEPWLPAVMLGLQDLARALEQLKPGSETRLMDVELMKQAKALGKELAHFETVEQQIAIFESIPLEEQVRELSDTLESDDSGQAHALLTSFEAGDQEALARAIFDNEQQQSAPGFYDRVLYERNVRWLPVIENEIARGGSFIAVGAAHLLGERGLLAELTKRGYTVARVQ